MTPTMRCETCRHWQSKNGVNGVCGAVRDRTGCEQIDDLPVGQLAEVQSVYSCTYSSLVTDAEFGCVLYAERGTP